MKTKADLVVSVLQGLRIIAAAENPSAEDSALVPAAYDRSRADKRAEENELLRGLRIMNAKPPSGEVTPFSSF